MTDFQTIRCEREGPALVITLNRPERLNAFTPVMRTELIAAFDRADADDAVRAVIVTGAGRGFCAGADLSEGAARFDLSSREGVTGPDGAVDWNSPALRDSGGLLALRIFASLKPVIAAVNGPAVGVGATMLLPMDIRLASEQARFGFAFTRRGLVPEACSSWFLPRVVGISRAMEWVATGRLIEAAEAMATGLVRSVHPPGDLLAAAHALVAEIAANTAPVAVALSRQMLWRMLGAEHPMMAHRIDSRFVASQGSSGDVAEGVAAFLEKRAPDFPNPVSTGLPSFYPPWTEPPLRMTPNGETMTDFTVLATGLRFPEGPVAMPDGSILLVEIARGTVSRVRPGGAVEVVADLGGGPNGLALGPDGALYVCNNGGFVWHDEPGLLRPIGTPADYSGGRIERVDLETGESRVLYTECGGNRLCGPNDIVFDRAGGFYFTDLGKSRGRDRDHGGVYYAACDGSWIKEVVHPILTPNGVGLSPDEATLYVASTEAGQLWAFDLEQPGRIQRHGFPSPNGGRMLFNQAGYQRYDSLAVDAAGNVCVATLITGQITVVSPGGDLVRQISFPDPYVTNICFGGPDDRTAYVTLSGSGRLVSMPWPEPGLRLNFSAG